jgi:hypothetical protein
VFAVSTVLGLQNGYLAVIPEPETLHMALNGTDMLRNSLIHTNFAGTVFLENLNLCLQNWYELLANPLTLDDSPFWC